MVVMGLDLAWCCLRFEHCSQKASQSCGWNMDINGLTIMALTIWVGIYNLLEMDIGFTCMHHFFYSVLVFTIYLHLSLRFGLLHMIPVHRNTDVCLLFFLCYLTTGWIHD